jgi:hypothetical protein
MVSSSSSSYRGPSKIWMRWCSMSARIWRVSGAGRRQGDTYPVLEGENLVVSEGVGLGDDGDEVDLGMQAAHDLDVQRLQRVAGRLDEVDAGVDAIVDDVGAVDLVLGLEIGVVSLLDVLDDGAPRDVVVDEVAEAGGVDDGQAQADAVLLDVGARGLDGDGLGADVQARGLGLLGRVEGRVEERVDQGRLSEAGLACTGLAGAVTSQGRPTNDHDVEVEALADALAVPLVGQVGEADVARQFPSHNVAHVAGGLRGGFGVLGRNGLGNSAWRRVIRLHVGQRRWEGLPLDGWGLAAPLVAGEESAAALDEAQKGTYPWRRVCRGDQD